MGKDTDFEECLITVVQSYPILYDLKNHQYKNTKLKETIWVKIGQALSKTAFECENLWKSLKHQYMAYRRKLDKPTGSASSRPPYFRHSLLMQFLKENSEADSDEVYSNISQVPADSQQTTEEMLAEVDRLLESDEESPTSKNLPVDSMVPPRTLLNNMAESQLGKKHRSHSTGKRTLPNFEEEILNILKGTTETDEDEFDLYGKFIAKKLRKLDANNPEAASSVQIEIQQVLINAGKDDCSA